MDLTFQVPMQYCSLQHWILLLSPVTSTTGCFCCCCCCCFFLALAPSLHSFWSYFSTLLQYHIWHLSTWGVHLSVSYIFAFSYCSWGSHGKNTEVVCHSLLQWTTCCQNWLPCQSCVALQGMIHNSIEIDKAVVHVITLVSFLWLVFILSALWWIMIRGLWKFPDGETYWGGNWVLFSLARPCSTNL